MSPSSGVDARNRNAQLFSTCVFSVHFHHPPPNSPNSSLHDFFLSFFIYSTLSFFLCCCHVRRPFFTNTKQHIKRARLRWLNKRWKGQCLNDATARVPWRMNYVSKETSKHNSFVLLNPSFKIPNGINWNSFSCSTNWGTSFIYVRRVSASLNTNVIITPKIVRESAQCL